MVFLFDQIDLENWKPYEKQSKIKLYQQNKKEKRAYKRKRERVSERGRSCAETENCIKTPGKLKAKTKWERNANYAIIETHERDGVSDMRDSVWEAKLIDNLHNSI